MVASLGFDLAVKQMDLSPVSPSAKPEAPRGSIDLSEKPPESEKDFSRSLKKVDRPSWQQKASVPKSSLKKTSVDFAKPTSGPTPDVQVNRGDLPVAPPAVVTHKVNETEPVQESQEDKSISRSMTPRQAVMMRFMKKMQSEMGVKPERIVQAMANLTPAELMRSPEETMNLVLNQLSIPLKDRPKAESLYQDMLDDTAGAALAEALAQSQNKGEKVNVEVLSQEQLQKRHLNQSIDQLNQNFYSNQSPESRGAQTQQNSLAQMQAQQELQQAQVANNKNNIQSQLVQAESETDSEIDSDGDEETLLAGAGAGQIRDSFSSSLAASSAESAPPLTSPTASALKPQAIAPKMAMKTEATPPTSVAKSEDFFSNQVPSSTLTAQTAAPVVPTPVDLPTVMQNEVVKTPTLEAEAIAPAAGPAFVTEKSSGNSKKSDSESDRDEKSFSNPKAQAVNPGADEKLVLTNPTQTADTQAVSTKTSAAALAPHMESTRADQIRNIQEIMSKAEVLVHGGGGEMKVQLNPEGLGQVNVKVSVQNGQVNIQMLTDNHEAKRSIESGLSDLRNHLSENKLNLDLVKVDVAQNPSSDLRQDQQRQQQEMAQDLAREYARGFMGNFREERQFDRDGMFSDPSRMKVYGGGVGGAKGRIEDDPATASMGPSSSRSQNRRLNVVA